MNWHLYFGLTILISLPTGALAGDSDFTQKAYLKSMPPVNGSAFGGALAVSGKTAVVSAQIETSNTGAVYVFVCTPAGWTLQERLVAPNGENHDLFGSSVAILGDTIVVGASGEDGDGSSDADNSAGAAGAAYAFVRSGSQWTQTAYLKASNVESTDRFGGSVAISGDTIAVGATGEKSDGSGETDNSLSNAGAVYVFVWDGTTWNQQAYLKASNPDAQDGFSGDLDIEGDTLVVGASREQSDGSGEADNTADRTGAVYVFVRDGTTWTQEAYLKASTAGRFDEFGSSVAISGERLVVGAQFEDGNGLHENDNSFTNSGAAYVFLRNGTAWTQEAYLKQSNIALDQNFGNAADILGNRIIIGAVFEDGDGSSETDTSADMAGAAYIFQHDGTGWKQRDYLKASNAEASDFFGVAVRISRYHAIIGASGEDGDGSSQSDNSASFSGAAYVFVDPVLTAMKSRLSRQIGKAKRKIRRVKKSGKRRKAGPLNRKKKRFIRQLRALC